MTTKPAPDEEPKSKVAKKVVADKRRYFVPEHNVSVEAKDAEDAVKQARNGAGSAEKEGDD